MADLTPSLVARLLPGLCSNTALPDGFTGWLIRGTYQLLPVEGKREIELSRPGVDEFVRYTSHDFERFSLSSKETLTVARVEKERFNLVIWPLLKLYYSAFFGAHAIMRSQGRGLVYLGRQQVDHLNALLSIVAPQFEQLSVSAYAYEYGRSQSTGERSINLRPIRNAKGAHETFWRLFCAFLRESADQATRERSANSNQFLLGANELVGAIRGNASQTSIWLSTIRNQINYQHKHDTWFPIRSRAESLRSLEFGADLNSSSVRFDISTEQSPLRSFANTARYIAFLSAEVSEHIAERSTVGGSFGQKWRRLNAQI